jgi:hypothetical protein
MAFGVATKNPFDLLGDENEDLSAAAARAAANEAKAVAAAAAEKKALETPKPAGANPTCRSPESRRRSVAGLAEEQRMGHPHPRGVASRSP